MTKCHYCKVGDMAPGFVTSADALGSLTMVVKGVPADVCGDCGEGWYSWDVVKCLGEMTDAAREAGVDVVIRRYGADKSVRQGARAANGRADGSSQAIVVSNYPVNDERSCFLCKNDALKLGITDTSLTRGDVAMVVKGVPAQVCTNCGEPYLERAVYERLKAEFKADARAGVEFIARKYAAAQANVKVSKTQASRAG